MCLDREIIMMFYKCVSYYAKHKSNQKTVTKTGMQIVWIEIFDHGQITQIRPDEEGEIRV